MRQNQVTGKVTVFETATNTYNPWGDEDSTERALAAFLIQAN